jgi:hypothetical protein
MKKHWLWFFIVFVCMFASIACGSLAALTPTPSPEPTSTLLPTATITPEPTFTFTPQPSETPAPTFTPTLALQERRSVYAGGYSFQAPDGFESRVLSAGTTIYNKAETMVIMMGIKLREDDSETLESELGRILISFSQDLKDRKSEKPLNVKYGEIDGLATNFTGTISGDPYKGQLLVADIGNSELFSAFILVSDGRFGNRWETEGRQVFDSIISSIEFFEPVPGSTIGLCAISTDPSYGYTKANPIKVGGNWFEGPLRETAYLTNLAGPNGEIISFERTGSENYGDTILDIFVITGLGKNVILYIDMYAFSEPQTPVGFTCWSEFTLKAP